MDRKHDASQPLCPSARPEMPGAVIFGVVGGTVDEPRVRHLAQPLPVTGELLALVEPASPLAVYRTAAPCAESACSHFAAGQCRLVSRVVSELPEATPALPVCRLRPTCKWWQQEGREACLRCPIIVTATALPSDAFLHAVDPSVYAEAEPAA